MLKRTTEEIPNTMVPPTLFAGPENTSPPISEDMQETIYDTLEYFDMLALASPRVESTDHIDPFLSRYAVPFPIEASGSDTVTTAGQTIRLLTWAGLIPSRWLLQLVCAIM